MLGIAAKTIALDLGLAELVFLDAVIPGRGARVCGMHHLWREWRILAWLAQAEAWLAVRRRMRPPTTPL